MRITYRRCRSNGDASNRTHQTAAYPIGRDRRRRRNSHLYRRRRFRARAFPVAVLPRLRFCRGKAIPCARNLRLCVGGRDDLLAFRRMQFRLTSLRTPCTALRTCWHDPRRRRDYEAGGQHRGSRRRWLDTREEWSGRPAARQAVHNSDLPSTRICLLPPAAMGVDGPGRTSYRTEIPRGYMRLFTSLLSHRLPLGS